MAFAVKVVPRARANAIEGWQQDTLKVRLRRFINAGPPVEGKANAALIALLADALAVGNRQIEIISAQTARTKLVRINGLTAEQVKMRLRSLTE